MVYYLFPLKNRQENAISSHISPFNTHNSVSVCPGVFHVCHTAEFVTFTEEIVNFFVQCTCKNTIFKETWIVTMESFSSKLTDAIALKCSRKGVLKILKNLQENLHTEMQLQDVIRSICQQTLDAKTTLKSCTFDVLDIISMFFAWTLHFSFLLRLS